LKKLFKLWMLNCSEWETGCCKEFEYLLLEAGFIEFCFCRGFGLLELSILVYKAESVFENIPGFGAVEIYPDSKFLAWHR
jgi:hypothetical protein